ncbi:membrane-bound lytic murein transglycosylase B [Nitrosomonas cryotolerans]|uniref:Membrane-bound lytic murein transglycosylase B n=1 Tax=Nitrosomonas cryotolerans ATCC 49181 TaxID=1131553 RepID=A0A1N6IUU1_9PROT|nr:lytic murein transglycosylase [Nitrosomonas cryotolerans]SFP84330.1 membrane-bound lytic murein transglycosylase B [Nitrosomonas cryotolerans]SIO35777.1 membrane-bound lytic murein transglycosylase B [Nitrosomonas cryotolerans ATCC 49181]
MPRNGIPGYSLLLGITLFFGATFSNPIQANNTPFIDCVSKLQAKARTQSISAATVNQILGKVKHVQQVIKLDRRQPEFTQTFADYFNSRISEERIRRGEVLLEKHRQLLEQIQQRTGVPAQYLIAFWGLETNYGSYSGNMPVLDSLATLACDQRRSIFFTDQLIDALRIIDAGDISAERMLGSWAGAMGHMQFMPSTYLRYARDGDSDGRRDLWGSIPDALTSAGFFLQQLGWIPGLSWGQEVKLPPSFDYTLAGRDQILSLAEWTANGVTTTSGTRLLPQDQEASLLVPASHQGPAFLVYKNFNVIMGWNRSELYALTVGHLADRITGGQGLHRAPPINDLRLTREQVRQLQQDLAKLGIDVGEADGVLGPVTRNALSHFQHYTQRIADGHIDAELLAAIREAAINQLRIHSGID